MFAFIACSILLYMIIRWSIKDFRKGLGEAFDSGNGAITVISMFALVACIGMDVGFFKSLTIASIIFMIGCSIRLNGVLNPIALPIFGYVMLEVYKINSVFTLIFSFTLWGILCFVDLILEEQINPPTESETTSVISDKVK